MDKDTREISGFLRQWGRFQAGKRWLGFERSLIVHKDGPYMDRWILYFGLGTLRLHKFYRGDDDRASHTHPWWFITFPLGSYFEHVFEKGEFMGRRVVRSWRPHFRAANFEHIVVCGLDREGFSSVFSLHKRPFYTIVLSGTRTNAWGFYPEPDKFIYWRDYV